jgi:UDP-N-acetyl-D-glucosamine dehydrogenase
VTAPVPHSVAVIGLGYVGLPLCLHFADSGLRVLGVDIDPSKVQAIREGRSYIGHIDPARIRERVEAGRLGATSDFNELTQVEAIVICVPTPLTKHREPDLSYILATARQIGSHLRRGQLVVLESTTYPGTTDGELKGTLEATSGLKAGQDFHLAFSPEREDPGNPQSQLSEIPKVVGGLTPACRDRAVALYRSIVKRVIPVTDCKTAEATKLLENIFRSVNIALVNELKTVYAAMGIDIWEVIEAASSKPFGFMPFYPGPGLGGHCIPIDPFYLTWKAREFGQSTRFIELAGEINTRMPGLVVQRLVEALNAIGKPLRGSRVLLLGLAYKANVDDPRESPGFVLLDLLSQGGASVDYFDPHLPVIGSMREHPQWQGKRSISWDRATLVGYDVALISTAHRRVNYQELADCVPILVDTRNVMAGFSTRPGQVWKA